MKAKDNNGQHRGRKGKGLLSCFKNVQLEQSHSNGSRIELSLYINKNATYRNENEPSDLHNHGQPSPSGIWYQSPMGCPGSGHLKSVIKLIEVAKQRQALAQRPMQVGTVPSCQSKKQWVWIQ